MLMFLAMVVVKELNVIWYAFPGAADTIWQSVSQFITGQVPLIQCKQSVPFHTLKISTVQGLTRTKNTAC